MAILMSSDSLRIGFFSDTYVPQINGAAISLNLLAQCLRARGHQVTVFAPKFADHDDKESGIYRIPSLRYMRKPPFFVAVPGTPRATLTVHHQLLDIVHTQAPFITTSLIGYSAARLKRIPFVYTYQTSMTDYTHYVKCVGKTRLVSWMMHRFSMFTCSICDYIIAPSKKFERWLLRNNVRRPITVIPNGIDLTHFQRSISKNDYRKRLNISSAIPLLLFVGRLGPEKRPDFIIDAFARIAHFRDDAHLVVAGEGCSRSSLEKQAAASGYAKRIKFLGEIDHHDMPNLMHSADIFLSASTTEVHSLAAIEAIASGLPIVAVWDEALEGTLIDGVNGRMVPRDAESFSNVVIDLIANPVVRRKFAKESLKLSSRFSMDTCADAVLQLYRRVINGYSSTLQERRHYPVP